MFRFGFFLSLFIGLTWAALPVHGAPHEHGASHEHAAPAPLREDVAEMRVAPRQVVAQVSGVVCSFCAQGVSRSLRKLPGLDEAQYKKGVLVEIERQLVLIAFAPGARVPLAEIHERIRKGGYDARSYHAWLEGELEAARAEQTTRAFHDANGLHFALPAEDARALALPEGGTRVALQLAIAPEALGQAQPLPARIERVAASGASHE